MIDATYKTIADQNIEQWLVSQWVQIKLLESR